MKHTEKGVNYTTRTRFNLRIDQSLLERIQDIKAERHTTVANVIEDLLQKALAQ